LKTRHLIEDGEALAKIIQRKSDWNFPPEPSVQPFAVSREAERKWFAAYTVPHHEKRVAEHLSNRDIEYFLPLYHAQHKWKNGLTANLELPLFPSYVFVRTGSQSERVRVLEVPGVIFMVGGTGRKPIPLPDCEINQLRAELHLRHPEPHPLLMVGQRVRICSGALAGMEGILERRKNSTRVVLTLETIRQSVAVEVNSDDLEPLESVFDQ
jgi:transcription antitermination factor NusG